MTYMTRTKNLCGRIKLKILLLSDRSGHYLGAVDKDRLSHLCDINETENEINLVL